MIGYCRRRVAQSRTRGIMVCLMAGFLAFLHAPHVYPEDAASSTDNTAEGTKSPSFGWFPVPQELENFTEHPDSHPVAAMYHLGPGFGQKVIVLVYNDGTLLWLRDRHNITARPDAERGEAISRYGPYHLGRVPAESVRTFLDRLEESGYFEDCGEIEYYLHMQSTDLEIIGRRGVLRLRTYIELESDTTAFTPEAGFVDVTPETKDEVIARISTEGYLRHREVYTKAKNGMFAMIDSIDPDEVGDVGYLTFKTIQVRPPSEE